MDKVIFKATNRDLTGKKVKLERAAGKLPGNIYGKGIESVNIWLDLKEISLRLRDVSGSTLIEVDVEGKKYNALIRETQRHPLTRQFLHIDFQRVSLDEKIRAQVAIEIVGDAPALSAGGMLMTGIDSLDIEAYPQDLVESVLVDVSGLTEFGDALYVRDITIPEGLIAHTDPEELVVIVSAPSSAPVTEEGEMGDGIGLDLDESEPEVIDKGKKEDEE
ncbi:MAG: 50S ribosomal protein L25 [Anaerolineales bacterium]|nr:50S ribosomal protein L25 [Anaerolineales bacterium]